MKINDLIYKYERQLKHSRYWLSQHKKAKDEVGGEQKMTYHGGYEGGVWTTKISLLQDIIDDLKEIEGGKTNEP